MSDEEILNINKKVDDLNIEELLKLIRKYHQIQLYTVDENWCIQLFDEMVCPNDIDATCDWESDDVDLKKLLLRSIDYIAQCVYNSWS